MSVNRYRLASGFTLIEVAIAVAIFATLAAITLKLSSSDVINGSGDGAFQAARTFDQQTNSIYNLVSQYSAYSAYSSLPTTAGDRLRVPLAGRTAYTNNGETVYFTIDLLNTAYRSDTNGGLIGIDDTATVSGSAIRQIPNGAESYSAVLRLYKDAVGGAAYATVPFSVIKNPCDALASASCPSMGTTANSLNTFLEAYYPFVFDSSVAVACLTINSASPVMTWGTANADCVNFDSTAEFKNWNGIDEDDIVTVMGGRFNKVRASDGNDTISVSGPIVLSGMHELEGGAGDDTVYANGGMAIICGDGNNQGATLGTFSSNDRVIFPYDVSAYTITPFSPSAPSLYCPVGSNSGLYIERNVMDAGRSFFCIMGDMERLIFNGVTHAYTSFSPDTMSNCDI